jgi:hypothetical protein
MTLPVAHANESREFKFHGYGDPTEVSRHETYGYVMKMTGDNFLELPVWYLNSSGFAQKLNPARLPYRKPCDCRERVLLIPNFQE